MSRKPVLLIVLATVLTTAACVHVRAVDAQADARAGLVGAWHSTIQFRSGPFASLQDLKFMYVFNLGGTMTESSNYDGSPPVPPAYGIWRRLGPNEFEAKYEFYVTKPPAGLQEIMTGGGWLPAGRGVFVERIVLSANGNSFTSTVRYEAFDIQGKPVDGGGEAEGRAVRLSF